MKYEVYYKGKATGIFVNDKSVSLTELRKIYPNAQPLDNIKFKLL